MEELKERVSIPIFIPAALPSGMELYRVYITQFVQSGEIWNVSIYYGTENDYGRFISIHARPEFDRPFPVWPVRLAHAHDEGPIYPEKITISQKRMLMLPSIIGHRLQWIEYDVLYSLVVEHDSNREAALRTAESLIQI
jgi:hypothetical protein